MVKSISSLSLMPAMSNAMNDAVKGCRSGRVLDPMLVTLPRQVELEPVMDSLCAELEQTNLVRFTGEKSWLNIRLGSPRENGFESFERMFTSMRRAAGYSNRFRGVVRIDVTEWLDSPQDERLQAVFAYIYDHAHEIFFIISATADAPERVREFKRALERWMYVNFVEVEPYKTETLFLYIQEKLASNGYTLNERAGRLLFRTIDKLSVQEDFAGLREMEGLANAISFGAGAVRVLTTEHIADFAPDGSWMHQRMSSMRAAIGFEGGNADGK